MTFIYLFQNKTIFQKTIHKPITIKQTSKYKYVLGLYKKTTKEINGLYSLKNGCFLYKKNNKYCIYDSRNKTIKQFEENAQFVSNNYSFTRIENALEDIFCKN